MFSRSEIWGTRGATLQELPTDPCNDEQSTRDTLSLMALMARSDAYSPQVQALARELDYGCSSDTQLVTSLWFWARDHIKLRMHEDIVSELARKPVLDKQLLIRPASLLSMPEPQGDCAIYSTFIASVLLALGMPAAFRVIATDPEDPERWSHVYVVTVADGRAFVLDASHGKYPGWEKLDRFRAMDWRVG